jgi:integrase
MQDKEITPVANRVKEVFEKEKTKNLPETDLVKSIIFLWNEHLQTRKTSIASRTYQSEHNSLTAFKNFLSTVKKETIMPENFTLKDAHKLESFLRESKAPNTVAKRVKHFKAFLKYYLKLGGQLGFNISDLIYKERPGPKVSLTEEELATLQNYQLSGRKAEVRDLFVLQCNTGLRISDLKRVDKNIEGNKIRLTTQKTGNDIKIPISPTIRQILDRYKNELPQVPDQKVNEGIKLILKDACPESKIQVKDGKSFKTIFKWEVISSHDSIRTFITLSAERGMSVPSIAQITGKSIQVLLKHYLNNSQKSAEVEFEKAWGSAPLTIVR